MAWAIDYILPKVRDVRVAVCSLVPVQYGHCFRLCFIGRPDIVVVLDPASYAY